jgi:hypothetical protein
VDYATADIREGDGGHVCVLWTDAIVDVRHVDKGQHIYLRLAKSELGKRICTDTYVSLCEMNHGQVSYCVNIYIF